MKILWIASSEHDLIALTDYIAHDSPQNALQIFTIIRHRHTVEKLQTYPFAGREGRVEDTRELIIPNLPYIVVYTVTKEILILAVLHTSRKWPGFFKK